MFKSACAFLTVSFAGCGKTEAALGSEFSASTIGMFLPDTLNDPAMGFRFFREQCLRKNGGYTVIARAAGMEPLCCAKQRRFTPADGGNRS